MRPPGGYVTGGGYLPSEGPVTGYSGWHNQARWMPNQATQYGQFGGQSNWGWVQPVEGFVKSIFSGGSNSPFNQVSSFIGSLF